MTLGEMKTLVSYWVDDLDFGYFTETQVREFLNQALREIQKYLVLAGENYYVKCVETPTVIGQADYVLPQDFMKLNRLEYIDGQTTTTQPITMDGITLNQKNVYPVDNGTPASYFLKKNRLILVPPPDSAHQLRLFYTYRIPELLNDTDTPDIPAEYHQAPAIWAAVDCLLKDGRDPSTLLIKKQEYLALFKQHADERTVDKPRMVVNTDNYYTGSYYY